MAISFVDFLSYPCAIKISSSSLMSHQKPSAARRLEGAELSRVLVASLQETAASQLSGGVAVPAQQTVVAVLLSPAPHCTAEQGLVQLEAVVRGLMGVAQSPVGAARLQEEASQRSDGWG